MVCFLLLLHLITPTDGLYGPNEIRVIVFTPIGFVGFLSASLDIFIRSSLYHALLKLRTLLIKNLLQLNHRWRICHLFQSVKESTDIFFNSSRG